ncbi:flavoprotein [Desulfitobacterium hafniense]|nr:flavoprotein [Desulfitobacterium hafniense]
MKKAMEKAMKDSKKNELKIAWGVTGAGHFLPSCLELALNCGKVEFFLSAAGAEVVNYYGLGPRLRESGHSVVKDSSASSLSVTKLYTGSYGLVVIAPVTGNSIAKMAHGIADNLITNLFAHAGKNRIPTVLLPCDTGRELTSFTPQGEEVPVYIRTIDRQNSDILAAWEGVTIVSNPEQLKNCLQKWQA